jgi:hypothetical protein
MNENIIESIKKNQDVYYSNSDVKTIFNKKELKKGCIDFVSQNIDLDKLISETIFIVKDSNIVFIDYTIFKTFASQLNYQNIVDSLVSKILLVSSIYQTFEVHLNLKSLTVSAIERYRPIFQIYYDTCCRNGLYYKSETFDRFVIYNTPMIINSVIPIIIKYTDQSIKSKIICNK